MDTTPSTTPCTQVEMVVWNRWTVLIIAASVSDERVCACASDILHKDPCEDLRQTDRHMCQQTHTHTHKDLSVFTWQITLTTEYFTLSIEAAQREGLFLMNQPSDITWCIAAQLDSQALSMSMLVTFALQCDPRQRTQHWYGTHDLHWNMQHFFTIQTVPGFCTDTCAYRQSDRSSHWVTTAVMQICHICRFSSQGNILRSAWNSRKGGTCLHTPWDPTPLANWQKYRLGGFSSSSS